MWWLRKTTSLQKYFALTANDKNLDHGYFESDGLLLRRWSPTADTEVADQVMQVVMPEKFCEVVLKTAKKKIKRKYDLKAEARVFKRKKKKGFCPYLGAPTFQCWWTGAPCGGLLRPQPPHFPFLTAEYKPASYALDTLSTTVWTVF